MPYNEVPSRRMVWDADGSVMISYDTGAATERSISNMNAESDGGGFGIGASSVAWVTTIFPEAKELDGIFVAMEEGPTSSPSMGAIQKSLNTTNGIDGTWTEVIANFADHLSTYDKFRNNIISLAEPSVKGVRARYTQGSNTLARFATKHIYGAISPGETPDRILFLDTEDADAVFTKVLDFGDVPRGQTTTRTFKIKNNSSSKTINTIQVTAEDLYLNAGDWYTFGDDGVNYQATFAVGNLGPGATKLLYLKQIIPDAETLGLHTGRIKASHASVT